MKESYNECPICLNNAHLPVVTNCGHVFCWDCIKNWVNIKGKMECPSCKSGINLDKVIKLYSGNNEVIKGEKDDRPKQKRAQVQYTNPNILHRIANNFGFYGYTNNTVFRPPSQKEVQRNIATSIVVVLIIAILIYIFNS